GGGEWEGGGEAGETGQVRTMRGAGGASGARVGGAAPHTSQVGAPRRVMASQHVPQSGSRRPAPSVVSHTGQSAGKTRSSAARVKLDSTMQAATRRGDAGRSSGDTAGN